MLFSHTRRRPKLAAALVFLSTLLIMAKAAFAFVGINDVKSGDLLLKTGEAGKFIEAPKVATDYTTTISGPTARTIVTQQFYNPSEGFVEGVYVFPLPDDSGVDTLKIVSGTRVIVGEVKEKVEAKQIYEEAKAKGQSAALLEQIRPNMFTNSVANIGPHEMIVVQIEYQQSITPKDGAYALRLPLVVAPRYQPAPIVTNVDFNASGLSTSSNTEVPQPPVLDPKTDGVANPVSITVNLNAGFELGDVASSYHKVDITDKGPDARVVSLSGIVPADRDFELTWKAKGTVPQAGLFKENVNGHDYLLGYVTPPNVDGVATDLPRDITFVIDNSGSMNGTSMPQAKQSLLYGLSQLKANDLFNIIRFDDTMTNVFGGSIPASEGNLDKAKNFVDALEAKGGTEMVPPMLDALKDPTPTDTTHLRQVVFITDGEISNEQQLFEAIAKNKGRSRVFMVGIGSAPNTYLMTHASELGRGTYTQIGEPSQLTPRMTDLFSKIGHPVITGLKAEIAGSNAKITPEMLPDVYRGEPVLLFADADNLTGMVKISGKIGDQPWEVSLPVDKAATGNGISKLWARRKIAEYEVNATLGALTQADADKAVLKVALEHQLVSSQTSLVAVDKSPKRPEGYVLTRADVPLNLPAGWVFESVFGPAGENMPKLDQKAEADLKQFASFKQSAAKTEADVALPQTATDARLLMLLAAALAIAGIFTLRKKVEAA